MADEGKEGKKAGRSKNKSMYRGAVDLRGLWGEPGRWA